MSTPLPRAELTCEEVDALLPLVADGALDAAADPALFAHLARCNDCQDALARHDLVTIALEGTRSASSGTASVRPAKREPIRHVFLPWPAALAASLLAAAGLWMWLSMMHAERPAAQTSAPQVVQVMGKDGHPVFVVLQGDQMTVIDPKAIDGRTNGDGTQVQAVKFPAANR